MYAHTGMCCLPVCLCMHFCLYVCVHGYTRAHTFMLYMYTCLRELTMQVEKQSVVLGSQTLGSKALPAFFSISTLLTRSAPITHMMTPPLPSLPSMQGQ